MKQSPHKLKMPLEEANVMTTDRTLCSTMHVLD